MIPFPDDDAGIAWRVNWENNYGKSGDLEIWRKRILVAIILSIGVLVGFQYFQSLTGGGREVGREEAAAPKRTAGSPRMLRNRRKRRMRPPLAEVRAFAGRWLRWRRRCIPPFWRARAAEESFVGI